MAAPDKYAGNGYIVWACITAINGTTLRGQASNREEANWAADGSLAFFTVTDAQLADVAAGDVLTMSVVSTGVHDAGASAGAVAAPGVRGQGDRPRGLLLVARGYGEARR